MKKFFVVVATAVLVLGISIDSEACNKKNCNHYTWVDDDSVENNTDVDNTNLNVNLNGNKNVNTNRNVNKNTLIQGQGQLQGQGQKQRQEQGQDQKQRQRQEANNRQSQSADNKGNTQTIIIGGDDYEDKRELITPPSAPAGNAEVTDHDIMQDIKTMGSMFARTNGMTLVTAQKLANISSDVVIKNAIMEPVGATERSKTALIMKTTEKAVTKKTSMKFIGYIYALPDGDDVTLAGMEGAAAKAAMEAGATHYFWSMSKGKYLSGSSVNIGIGGGASMFAAGGDIGIAPSGGLGWGTAWSNNEIRPALMLTCFREESLAKMYIEDKKQIIVKASTMDHVNGGK